VRPCHLPFGHQGHPGRPFASQVGWHQGLHRAPCRPSDHQGHCHQDRRVRHPFVGRVVARLGAWQFVGASKFAVAHQRGRPHHPRHQHHWAQDQRWNRACLVAGPCRLVGTLAL
jgi:hypothetical protein